MTRRLLTRLSASLLLTAALGGAALADVSKKVQASFKGQLVVSKGELPAGNTDKETAAKIKSERLKEVVGEKGDEVTIWNFHYTAFLSKVGASSLKMEFYKGSQLAADKQLSGVDPKSSILSGDITIDEDEGLAKGTSYVVKLVTEKDAVVSSTTLLMN